MKLFCLLLIMSFLILPVMAVEFTAPEVPKSGQALMPYEPESFGDGLWSIFSEAMAKYMPMGFSAARNLVSIIGITLLLSCIKLLPGTPEKTVEFVAVVTVSSIFLSTSSALVCLATETVGQMSEYAKLLFPVLTAALAAQGGITSAGALYTGTMLFITVLSNLITSLAKPIIYIFLSFSILFAATQHEMLGKLKDLCKWAITWSLKTILYIFTGYMSITGVVSGSTDAATLKATTLTISGMVPVVGGILADTSEAVIVGARIMKNSVGIYGMYAVLALWISPFFETGIRYLMLKTCFGICGVFPVKRLHGLMKDFSGAMGLLLAITGTVCLMLVIGIVCFMKGNIG